MSVDCIRGVTRDENKQRETISASSQTRALGTSGFSLKKCYMPSQSYLNSVRVSESLRKKKINHRVSSNLRCDEKTGLFRGKYSTFLLVSLTAKLGTECPSQDSVISGQFPVSGMNASRVIPQYHRIFPRAQASQCTGCCMKISRKVQDVVSYSGHDTSVL